MQFSLSFSLDSLYLCHSLVPYTTLFRSYDPATGDIMETFVGRGSSGGCEKNLTAMTRLISVALRGGVPFDYVIDQLESCGGCGAYQTRRVSKKDTSPGSSCATAIAIALKEMQEAIYRDVLDEDTAAEPEQDRERLSDPAS